MISAFGTDIDIDKISNLELGPIIGDIYKICTETLKVKVLACL